MNMAVIFYIVSVAVSGLTIAIAAVGAATAQGKAASAAFDAMARQPEIQSGISGSLILSLALIESLAIYALAISLVLLFANPFSPIIQKLLTGV